MAARMRALVQHSDNGCRNTVLKIDRLINSGFPKKAITRIVDLRKVSVQASLII
jgi:hypothetical protein